MIQARSLDLDKKSIFVDILLTLLTFGLWNLWVQIRQIADVNEILGKNEYPSIFKLFFLSIITFGIYFCYHEYALSKELHLLNYKESLPFVEYSMAFLTFIGLWFIVDSYQQSLLNHYVDNFTKRRTED